MAPKRILYIATMRYGAGDTAFHRMQAMEDLGHDVTSFNLTSDFANRMQATLPMRALRKLFGVTFDWNRTYQRLRVLLQEKRFDAMWIDKGIDLNLSIFESFRRSSPGGLIIGYSPDDMMNPGNKTERFVGSLPLYDFFFTTKSFHVDEFSELGCKSVHFIDNSYHEPLHHPMALTDEEQEALKAEVVFLGAWEQERSDFLVYLAENGVPVRVWGNDKWAHKIKSPPASFLNEARPLYGVEYTKALNAAKMSICFLRKANRDLQTTRSVELPGCGTFMLAERTDEHMALFEEGKEAEFFSTKEELLEKVRYYLEHDEEREAIAKAGRQRCLDGEYSNHGRMKQMLSIVFGE